MKSLNKVANSVLTIIFTTILLLVTLQVLNRLVFNTSSAWTEELSRYFYIWLTFYGAILVTRDREQIQVDFLLRKLPRPLRFVVNKINTLLIIIFLLVFVYGGYVYTRLGLDAPLSTVSFIQMGYVVSILPISGIILFLIYTYRLFKDNGDEES